MIKSHAEVLKTTDRQKREEEEEESEREGERGRRDGGGMTRQDKRRREDKVKHPNYTPYNILCCVVLYWAVLCIVLHSSTFNLHLLHCHHCHRRKPTAHTHTQALSR